MYNFLRNRKNKASIIGQYLPKEVAEKVVLRKGQEELYTKKQTRSKNQ